MTWIYLAIIPAIIWAVVNVVDKYLISKHIKEPLLYIFFTGIIGLVIVLVIPFIDFYVPALGVLIAAFVAGGIYIYAQIPYFRSLRFEEVSRVIALWQLVPIFTFFIAYFTIGEDFSWSETASFVLLILGGILVSLKFTERRFQWSKAFGLMLLSCMLFGVHYVLVKYILMQTNFWNGFLWLRLATAANSLLLLALPSSRKRIVQAYRELNLRIKTIFFSNEYLGFAGAIINGMAISLASPALVGALLAFQPALVFIFTIIVSLKFKNILEEKLDFKNLAVKIAGIVLVIGGLLILCL